MSINEKLNKALEELMDAYDGLKLISKELDDKNEELSMELELAKEELEQNEKDKQNLLEIEKKKLEEENKKIDVIVDKIKNSLNDDSIASIKKPGDKLKNVSENTKEFEQDEQENLVEDNTKKVKNKSSINLDRMEALLNN